MTLGLLCVHTTRLWARDDLGLEVEEHQRSMHSNTRLRTFPSSCSLPILLMRQTLSTISTASSKSSPTSMPYASCRRSLTSKTDQNEAFLRTLASAHSMKNVLTSTSDASAIKWRAASNAFANFMSLSDIVTMSTKAKVGRIL